MLSRSFMNESQSVFSIVFTTTVDYTSNWVRRSQPIRHFFLRLFQLRFSRLFDDAPQIPYSDVERVICREFGVKSVGDIFSEFEAEAVASASVAQVHRARLKDGLGEDGRGTLVAVKVQKPDVTQQVEWDLNAYKFLMWYVFCVATFGKTIEITA